MKQTHTSQELAEKLQAAGFKGETLMYFAIPYGEDKVRLAHEDGLSDEERTPAYDILNDLCNKYAKECFGEDRLCHAGISFKDCNFECTGWTALAFQWHSEMMLGYLQQGKKAEAELYFWSNTILNPKNQ